MPNRLLRSVMEFGKEISSENLVRNFQHLRRAVEIGQFSFFRSEDEQIYKYLLGYCLQYAEMPSSQTVTDYFQSVQGLEAVERVKDIQTERPYSRTNFVNLLRSLQENQAQDKVVALLKETHDILIKGIENKKTKEVKKGVEEAILHFTQRSQEIRVIDNNLQIHGDVREDGDKMKEEYEMAKNDRGRVIGSLSGVNEIDDNCKGAKKGELWVHAGFPGELKTTFAINWCYNDITLYKKNVVYVSFEMPRDQIRRVIYSLHTSNPKFAKQGYPALDYRSIRDGLLTKQEEEFYANVVIPDFGSNQTYTHFDVVTPDRDWTMSDIKAQLEMLHKEFEIGLVVLDHGQWIEARKSRKNKDYVIELNSVVNDAKRLALTFDNNNGVPILLLFQINRQGKEAADKNNGVYSLSALTYANACEKSADVITTTYLNDQLRADGLTKFTNLKNRDNPLFTPFEARVDFKSRKITSIKRMATKGFSVESQDAYLSSMEISL
jgi:replicative DNA helicase